MIIGKHGCQNCKRKSPLNLTCKCHKVVCIECRYPDEHGCTYDYKKEAEEKIRKENPVVTGEKLDKV